MTTRHPATLTTADLRELIGYSRQADLERWCQEHGVRYFRGRSGIWTTLTAVDAALGLRDTPDTQIRSRPRIEL